MSRELLYLTANEALERFSRRTLSPVELMSAVLAEAERVQPMLNATIAIHAEAALAQARAAEQRHRDGTARPLEGIPVAIKEETAVAGWRRTIGSFLLDEMPQANHPMVDKLIAAGAIPHLQTSVPEFCLMGTTWNRRFGVSRNPWNPRYTPGGSSGGSGAALAAGLAPLATGSDMAGSIRIPAAQCGVYGYKPPFGRLASAPGEELFEFAVEGPMARSFADLRLMQNIVAGPHPASYVGLPHEPLPGAYPDIRQWRIAYSLLPGGRALCPDIRANMLRAVAQLRERGASVEEVDIPWDMREIADTLLDAIYAIYFGAFTEKFSTVELARTSSYVRLLAGRYPGRRGAIPAAARLASSLHQDMQARVWGAGYRAFLCPTLFTTAMPADLDIAVTPTIDIEGVAVDSYLGWLATPPFNLMSRYPALAVPTGLARTGVPTGMQIVAPPYADAAAFTVGYHHAEDREAALYRTRFPASG